MKLPQSIGLSSVCNARELGGYKTGDGRRVKHGALLRTASLNSLSPQDAGQLEKDYGLALVVDFRDSQEAERNPDNLPDAVAYTLLPVISRTPNEGAKTILDIVSEQTLKYFCNISAVKEFMANDVYRKIARDRESAKSYGDFFKILLHAESTVLYHCTSGKDRTGIASVLLLVAMGVEKEVIIQDYLLTNKYVATEFEAFLPRQWQDMDSEKLKQLMLLQGVDKSYIHAYLEEIQKQYGSLARYLREEIGLDAADQRWLADKYTEKV